MIIAKIRKYNLKSVYQPTVWQSSVDQNFSCVAVSVKLKGAPFGKATAMPGDH